MTFNSRIHFIALIVAYSITVLIIGFFLYCYFFCLKTNPDLIRSEKFVTDKLLIERGIIGDDIKGAKEVTVDAEYETITRTEEIDG
jgi:hypothetical protein